jgi:hypothetical protein
LFIDVCLFVSIFVIAMIFTRLSAVMHEFGIFISFCEGQDFDSKFLVARGFILQVTLGSDASSGSRSVSVTPV